MGVPVVDGELGHYHARRGAPDAARPRPAAGPCAQRARALTLTGLALALVPSAGRSRLAAVATWWPAAAPGARPRARAEGGATAAPPAVRGAVPAGRARGRAALRSLRWRQSLLVLVASLGLVAFSGQAALAVGAGGAAAAKPHVGERLAVLLQRTLHLPNWLILMLLSALPLIELRGGVPVGVWMGLGVPQVLFLCVLGNMLPIPLILFALRSPRLSGLLAPVLRRAQKKTQAIGAHDRWVGVAAFVGVPLPGTGAWTGAMVAHLLGMGPREAVTSILAGVCVASCIMASLTLAGWYGCAVACCVGAVALGSRFLPGRRQ